MNKNVSEGKAPIPRASDMYVPMPADWNNLREKTILLINQAKAIDETKDPAQRANKCDMPLNRPQFEDIEGLKVFIREFSDAGYNIEVREKLHVASNKMVKMMCIDWQNDYPAT